MEKKRTSEDVKDEPEDNHEHVEKKRHGRPRICKTRTSGDTEVIIKSEIDDRVGDGICDASAVEPLPSSTFAADSTFAAICERTTPRTRSYSQTPIATRGLLGSSCSEESLSSRDTFPRFKTENIPSFSIFSRRAQRAYHKEKSTMSYSTAPNPRDEIENLELYILELLVSHHAKREEQKEVRKLEDQVREDEDRVRRIQNRRRHAEYLRREREDKQILVEDGEVEALRDQVKVLQALLRANKTSSPETRPAQPPVVEPIESPRAQRSKRRKLGSILKGNPDVNDFGPLSSEINRLFLSTLKNQVQTAPRNPGHLPGFPLTEREQELEYLCIPPAPIYAMKFHEFAQGQVRLPGLVFRRELHDFESLGHTGVKYSVTSAPQPACVRGLFYGISRQFNLDGERIRQYCCSECPIPVFRGTVEHAEHISCHACIFESLL